MTALIVDDNAENVYLLDSILRANGYASIVAKNGAEALGQAHKQPPDLIITDILMPVMDGYTFCRECKRDERLKDIPLVFYTATYTDPKDEEFALSLGADKFILKPQEPEVFMEMIQEVVLNAKRLHNPNAHPPELPEVLVLEQYNQTLIRKLEDKMRQTEDNERRLKMYVVELEKNLQERKKAEAMVRKSLQEKEILLKEVHHRVKNNMQVVCSLLKLQLDANDDPSVKTALHESISRIRSMAIIHDNLYRSDDYAEVNFGAYVHAMVGSLREQPGLETAEWKIHVDDVHLGLDKSVPFGLLFNELTSHLLKHTAPRTCGSSIVVELKKIGGDIIHLRVADESSDGGPAGGGIGVALIELLVDQLGGNFKTESKRGWTFIVEFPG